MGEVLPLSRERRECPDATLAARTDDELMALVRLESQSALRFLVERHSERVSSFCARLTGDRHTAVEVTQEVWVALWESRKRWVAQDRFAAFLYTIAYSRATNRARGDRRRERQFVSEPLAAQLTAAEAPSEIERLLARERSERLWQALGVLPSRMREAVVLRFIEELSYEEIGRTVGARESTLRARVHHALSNLRSSFKERL